MFNTVALKITPKFWRQNLAIYPPFTHLINPENRAVFYTSSPAKPSQKYQIKMKKKNEKPPKQDEQQQQQHQQQQQQYWLLKTEVGEWSWEDQKANGGKSKWDGVKNKQAQKYLKSMKLGDLCLFYHSGAKARRVVGVVTVEKECYDDGDDGGVAVDVVEVGEMRRVVDLGEMKADERLKKSEFALFRQPRLSVVPVSEEVWGRVCELGGGYVGDGGAEEDGS